MPAPTRRVLEVADRGDVTVVKFVHPALTDEEIIKAIGDQVFHIVDGGRTRLCLDFTGVDYVASAMLGKMLAIHKKLKAAGGELTLSNLGSDILEALDTSRLIDFFKIAPGDAAAKE